MTKISIFAFILCSYPVEQVSALDLGNILSPPSIPGSSVGLPSYSSGVTYWFDEIHFKNNCAEEIYTAIHYLNTDKVWTTHGWWMLKPGQTVHVANSTSEAFFSYAEGVNSKKIWGNNDAYFNVRNSSKKYGFEKVATGRDWTNFTYSFSC